MDSLDHQKSPVLESGPQGSSTRLDEPGRRWPFSGFTLRPGGALSFRSVPVSSGVGRSTLTMDRL